MWLSHNMAFGMLLLVGVFSSFAYHGAMSTVTPRLSDFLPYRLSVTSNAVSNRIAADYKSRFGLNVPEWRVMAVLGDVGALTQRQLVGATFMDKVAVNRACKVLADRGLVERSPNDSDGRSHMLELTDSGREMHGQIMPLALRLEGQLVECLTAAEQRSLRKILDKLFAQVRDSDLT